MLKCNKVTHLASDYLDKNLNWKDHFSMKMHIAMCKHCRRFLHHLRLTVGCVHSMKQDLTSTEDIEHVLKNIPDKNK